jgi:hypothetical protein
MATEWPLLALAAHEMGQSAMLSTRRRVRAEAIMVASGGGTAFEGALVASRELSSGIFQA